MEKFEKILRNWKIFWTTIATIFSIIATIKVYSIFAKIFDMSIIITKSDFIINNSVGLLNIGLSYFLIFGTMTVGLTLAAIWGIRYWILYGGN